MTSPLRLSPRTANAASRQTPRVELPKQQQVAKKAVDGFEQKKSVTVLVLQRGMTGAIVTGLQQKLVAARFMSSADFKSGPGVYGPRTEAAVKRLQAYVGLPVTGVAGPSTFSALNGGARFEERSEVTAPIQYSRVQARLAETFSEEVTQSMGVPL